MKKGFSVVMDERKKSLLIYICLLIGSLFFAVGHPEQAWLSVGIGVGIVAAVFIEIFRRNTPKKELPDEEPEKKDDP